MNKRNYNIIIICILIIIILYYLFIDSFKLFTTLNQNGINNIYNLLQHIDCEFNKNNIPYIMIGGTLLGSVRHNGLIPWDTDGDLAVINKSFDEILTILKPLKKYNIEYYLNRYGGIIKVKYKNSKEIIDIFILEKTLSIDNEILYRFSFPYNKKYPNEYFTHNELFPLYPYKFGPLILNGPNLYINYLNRTYKNWNNIAEDWIDDYMIIKSSQNKDLNTPALPTDFMKKKCYI